MRHLGFRIAVYTSRCIGSSVAATDRQHLFSLDNHFALIRKSMINCFNLFGNFSSWLPTREGGTAEGTGCPGQKSCSAMKSTGGKSSVSRVHPGLEQKVINRCLTLNLVALKVASSGILNTPWDMTR